MKKWEYRIKYCKDNAPSLFDLLDKMTNEGWEVCSHSCDAAGYFSFIFKREKKDA